MTWEHIGTLRSVCLHHVLMFLNVVCQSKKNVVEGIFLR